MKKNTRKQSGPKRTTLKRKRFLRGGLQNPETIQKIQQDLTIHFLEILMMVKIFHWKTQNYSTHKASDELYEKLNELFDKFIEVLLGKTNIRTNLLKHHKISLVDLSSDSEMKPKINQFKNYLVSFNKMKIMNTGENTDLYNIRDEILGECNKFLYLLSLS